MAGQVFVVYGDITKLCCDAGLVPSRNVPQPGLKSKHGVGAVAREGTPEVGGRSGSGCSLGPRSTVTAGSPGWYAPLPRLTGVDDFVEPVRKFFERAATEDAASPDCP